MAKLNRKPSKHIISSIFQWIGMCVDILTYWLRKLWYVILLGISTPYVICNFDEIVDFQFFSDFNGKNLIFLVWLVLLLIPLFDSFEGFGISIKRFRQRSENKQLNELLNNQQIPTQEELEKQLDDESK